MSRGDQTGYGPADDEEAENPIQVWRVEKAGSRFYSGVPVQITADDEPLGVLHLNNEDEFRWLKARLDGEERRRTDEEMGRN